jgi:hypothetical protein
VAHGVDGAVGEGGDEDGPGGVGLAPRLDDLGDARRPSAGLNDCGRTEHGGGTVSGRRRRMEGWERRAYL